MPAVSHEGGSGPRSGVGRHALLFAANLRRRQAQLRWSRYGYTRSAQHVGSKKHRMRKLAPAPALTVPPTIAKYQSTEDIVRSAFHATLTAKLEADLKNIP